MISTQSFNATKNAGEALKHFAAAFFFLVLGLIALLLNSELLANGNVRSIHVVTGLHFITLGWLTLSIFGALQVFTGVALGGVELSGELAPWGRWLWCLGLVLFVSGLFTNSLKVSALGFSFLGVSLILYSSQIFPALYKAKRGKLTRVFIMIAFISLWLAWLLGVISGLARLGWTPAAQVLPVGYLQAHILLAVFGWVGSMVIGVGSHLIPMFALARDTTQRPLKITLIFWTALPVVGVISAFYPNPWTSIGWRLAALGSLGWSVQVFLYFRNRVRREKDYGLLIAALATSLMILAWFISAFTPNPTPFLALVIIGWLSFFTLGIYHRVLPFLVWFMKFSRPIKGFRPPKVKDLIDPGISLLISLFVFTGILIWITGLWVQALSAIFVGSALMLTGVLLSLGHLKTLGGGVAISTICLNKMLSRMKLLSPSTQNSEKREVTDVAFKRDNLGKS